MRFGLFLTTRHMLAEHPSAAVETHLAEVRLARDLGYDSVFAGHHFLPYPLPMVQLWPLLGRISAEAGEMRIGTGVIILAAANPLETAEQAATLDALTNGRFTLGVGIGYRDEDVRAFAIPGKRARVFTEKLDVVRRLLESGHVTARGPGYDLDDDYMTLRCVRQPRCPIWMAATRDWGVRKAAELADTWLVSPLACIRDLELWRERSLVGSPDSVVEQLRLYRDRLGATEILFRPRWAGLDPRIGKQTLELLAREVIPHV